MNLIFPVEKLAETSNLMAFYHPRPSYPVHILLIPKKEFPTFMDLSFDDTGILSDLVITVQKLVKDLNLEENGYRLIVNGGKYQSFPYLHFHLVSGSELK